MKEYEEKLIEWNEKAFQELFEYQGISQAIVVRNIIAKLEKYEEVGIKLEI